MLFEPVKFEDYKRDMDELGSQAAAVISRLVEERDELRYRLWLVVNAAGGEVAIHDNDLVRNMPEDCVLNVERSECDASVTIRTAKK